MPHDAPDFRRFRFWLALFVIGLVLSGVTAFPLQAEMRFLCSTLGIPAGAAPAGLPAWQAWLATIRDGLIDTYAKYPWISYGTDWLAFGHLVIAMFFIGPWRDPIANHWVIHVGIVACASVFVLAFIAGPIRGIPFAWQLIDCSFGVAGAFVLWMALRSLPALGREKNRQA